MNKPQSSLPSVELVDVEVETFGFRRYAIPAVPFLLLWQIIRSDNLHGLPSLSIMNNDQACLVVPSRLIRFIFVDGQVFWEAKHGKSPLPQL